MMVNDTFIFLIALNVIQEKLYANDGEGIVLE